MREPTDPDPAPRRDIGVARADETGWLGEATRPDEPASLDEVTRPDEPARAETSDEPDEGDRSDGAAAPWPDRRRLGLGAAVLVAVLAAAAVVAVMTLGRAGASPAPTVTVAAAPVTRGAGVDGTEPGKAGAGADRASPAADDSSSDPSGSSSEASSSPAPLVVHVLGAVARPGLVTLAPGARVVDAVAAAGGTTPDADPRGVNLARPLADGEQIVVPAVGEASPVAVPGDGAAPSSGGASTSSGGAASAGAVVDVNTADADALETLPRIGPALAGRIIDYRAAHGPFRSVDDLKDVAGIGDVTFAGLEDRVRV